MIKTILFDLDGTMLPMDQDKFIKIYFTELCKRFCPVLGVDEQTLVKAMWKATGAMIKNDRSDLNINVFWKSFAKLLGRDVLNRVKEFDNFYENEFIECKASTKYNPAVPEAVKVLKSKGYRVIAATNPLFPPIATNIRLNWAGVDKSDFSIVTTYDNSSSCKPNPLYFAEILDNLNLEAEECLMVGNDVDEDMVSASSLNMDTYLVTDCLINRSESDYSAYKQGSFKDFLNYSRMMPDVK